MKPPSIRELAYFLYLQRLRGFDPPTDPWFPPETLAWFERLLSNARLYLEFGCGGSTLVADRLGVRTLSIESDRFYARAVRSALSAESSATIVDVDIGITGPRGVPLLRRPTPSRLEKWRTYVHAAFRVLGEEAPDFILIDGRFRLACALATLRHIALRGADASLMIDDYSKHGREGYAAIEVFAGRPTYVGSAALFTLSGGALQNVPTDAQIMDAVRDYQ